MGKAQHPPPNLSASPAAASRRRPAGDIARVVALTLSMHVAIVVASLAVPVMASLIAVSTGMAPHLVGYYSGLLYGAAALSSLATPGFVHRFGVIRLHQGMLVMIALSLLALLSGVLAAFVVGAVLLGLAYGPTNPASTVLLSRVTPPHLRARVFSLKQTAVPLGGALAGFMTPRLAILLGWRGTTLVLALLCLALALLAQVWRGEFDRGRDPRAAVPVFRIWRPARVMLRPRMRVLALASLAFAALQFCFSAVFVTVLTESAGWDIVAAGSALSFALILSIVGRIVLGWVADVVPARLVLALLGFAMAGSTAIASSIDASWSMPGVFAVAAAFGLSTSSWNGIALAEAVARIPDAISEASAGLIGFTFLGALLGPAVYSVATGLTGEFGIAFLALAAFVTLPSALLLASSGRGR